MLVSTILKGTFQARHPDFALVGQVSNMLLLKVGQTTHNVKEMYFQYFLLTHIIKKIIKKKNNIRNERFKVEIGW